MRLPIVVIAFVVSACTHTTDDWRFNGDYYVTSEVTGCFSFQPNGGKPFDRSVVPSFAFQRHVNILLQNTASRDPERARALKGVEAGTICFYERPNKDVWVLIGDFCGPLVEVTLQQDDNGWAISRFDEPTVSCLQKK